MYKNFLCTSIMGHTLSVILRHTLHVIHGCALKGILNHLFNVILGFIPRIYTKHTPMDTRVKPEYDYKRSLVKGLDVVRQCAALLERLKTHIKIPPLFCHPRVMPENDHNNLRPQCAPDTT